MVTESELNQMTPGQILEAIQSRHNQIKQMVGWLYPSVLRGEIDQLYKRLNELRRKELNKESPHA